MPPSRASKPSCAVVVLNWNGRAHLEILLASLYDAASQWGAPLPIVVVDNRSTAGDVDWLRAEHPRVEVVVAERNDFLFSLNPIVAGRHEDIVIVLNNDMRVDPGFVAPLVAHFANPQVFAVAASVWNWDGNGRQHGQRLFRVERFWCQHWFNTAVTGPCYTGEAGGGCSAYRRTYFAALGGFDPLYRPAYWEDFDLTYRAWARGWQAVLEPASIIYHRGSATLTETLPAGRMGRVMARNQFLFILRNIGGWGFVLGVLAFAPYRWLVHGARGHWTLVRGQLAAIPRVPAALNRRWRSRGPALSPRTISTMIRRDFVADSPSESNTRSSSSASLSLAPAS